MNGRSSRDPRGAPSRPPSGRPNDEPRPQPPYRGPYPTPGPLPAPPGETPRPSGPPPTYPPRPSGPPPAYPPRPSGPPPASPPRQSVRREHYRYPPDWMRRRRRRTPGCLGPLLAGGLALAILVALYFLFPGRTNILLLGVDYVEPWSMAGRTDTMILATVKPLPGEVGLVSIPRDLWVQIPGVGEDRINTAHFYAEVAEPGSGPRAAMQTVEANFGVHVSNYVRIRFEGFRHIFNAMGGVDVVLVKPMAGYLPGTYHLSGNKALAFARSREGADDFFRMENGQFILRTAFRQMLEPRMWRRWPAVLKAAGEAVQTNIPFWKLPRLALALLRAGPGGINSRTIGRDMVSSYTTSGGASVLLPNWERINPLIREVFFQ